MIGFPITFGHGPISLNEHFNADGSKDSTKLSRFQINRVSRVPGFRSQRDPYHLAQGGSPGQIHKSLLTLSVSGIIKAGQGTNQAAILADREMQLRAAFDPYLCSKDSPSTQGVYAWDYTERTADSNYPSGLILSRIYVRPESALAVVENSAEADSREFGLTLIAYDPRVYDQTESTLSLTIGAPSGSVVNKGSCASALKATITMAGAGATNFTITRSGVSFVLNLSSCANNDVVTVVFETCGPYGLGKYIKKNASETASLRTSDASTWLDVPVGTTTFAITNTTNVTSCVLAWRSARP